MFPFDHLENIRKPKLSLMFPGGSNGDIGKKRVKTLSIAFSWPIKYAHKTSPEASLHRRSYEKVSWKYEAILQENTHVEVWFQ